MPEVLVRVARRVAGLPDAQMDLPWAWPGHPGRGLLGREALYRALEAEQSLLAVAAPLDTEVDRMLDQLQVARGDLLGLLASVPDESLDLDPQPGGWMLRQVLAHLLVTERRYLRHTHYAPQRLDTDPVYQPIDLALLADELVGGVEAWMERLRAEGIRTATCLSAIDIRTLERPSVWAGFEVDVRFRLHRFAAHVVEHTVHAEKVLCALDISPGEAGRIMRALWRLRAAHERHSAPNLLQSMDQVLADACQTLENAAG